MVIYSNLRAAYAEVTLAKSCVEQSGLLFKLGNGHISFFRSFCRSHTAFFDQVGKRPQSAFCPAFRPALRAAFCPLFLTEKFQFFLYLFSVVHYLNAIGTVLPELFVDYCKQI